MTLTECLLKKSGAEWACSSPVDGSTMLATSPSPISCSSGGRLPVPFSLLLAPEHFLTYSPNQRPLGTDPTTGDVNPELERKAKQKYEEELSKNIKR